MYKLSQEQKDRADEVAAVAVHIYSAFIARHGIVYDHAIPMISSLLSNQKVFEFIMEEGA